MKTALLIVDVQTYFLEGAPQNFSRRIADHITNNAYDLVAFTVFKNHDESNFVRTLNWNKCFSEEDSTLPKELQLYQNNENMFIRATYSGFETTHLDEYLKENEITKIIICGVDSEACVLATAFSAFDRGYAVEVNFDLTYSSGDLKNEARAIAERTLKPKS